MSNLSSVDYVGHFDRCLVYNNDYFKLYGGRSIKGKSILQMIELLLSIKTTWHQGEF